MIEPLIEPSTESLTEPFIKSLPRRFLSRKPSPAGYAADANRTRPARLAIACALAALVAVTLAPAQVITIDTSGRAHETANGPVDVRYSQITPTHVDLSKQDLDSRTRLSLIRALTAEQGFAMRPFPRGHKGLTLEANGKLNPAGEAYLDMATTNGLSAKPGDRLVITNVNIDRNRIVFDLNGGPDPRHRFLRHVQIGMGGPYDDPTMDQPVAGDPNQVPAGARLTLEFHGHIPELTASEVESLLKPLISFNVETPVEAFTNTLPTPLKNAILNHEVWVGMTQDMVQFAKGDPDNKWREMEGQMPVVSWVYGKPPETVVFVRFNGNRVIRVEICPIGKPPDIYTKDVVTPLMMGRPMPEMAEEARHPVEEGDVQINPQTQAPAPPPTLGQPGEKIPQTQSGGRTSGTDVPGPVYFPPDIANGNTQLGQNPDTQPPAAAPQPPSAPANGTQSAPANGTKPAPANTSQPSNSPSAPSDATQQQPQPKPPPQEQLLASGRAD